MEKILEDNPLVLELLEPELSWVGLRQRHISRMGSGSVGTVDPVGLRMDSVLVYGKY